MNLGTAPRGSDKTDVQIQAETRRSSTELLRRLQTICHECGKRGDLLIGTYRVMCVRCYKRDLNIRIK